MMLDNSLTRSPVNTPAAADRTLPRLFEGERLLVILGLLGPVLSAILTVVYFMHGPVIGQEGVLMKPITFDLALGLFIINTAAVMPLAGFAGAGRTAMRWTVASLASYSYAVETIQVLRGYDPRFSNQFHSLAEALPNLIFAVVSVLIIATYVFLMYRFFRATRTAGRKLLSLGVRYGMLSVMAAFAAGVWMISIQGRHVGAAGNILALHSIGFEGFKALLLTAWLAERSRLADGLRRRWIHVAGLAWLGACAAIFGQTRLGLSVFTLSPLMFVALLCTGIWAAATFCASSGRPAASSDISFD